MIIPGEGGCKMVKKNMIRKEVGNLRKMSPLKRAFKLKRMIEDIRGERLDFRDENVRKIVGRVKQKQC